MHWHGADYDFTAKQAMAVSEWWAAWENKTPFIRDETVIMEIGLNAKDKSRALFDLFKGHPAWGTMIVQGRPRGTHGLAEPTKKK